MNTFQCIDFDSEFARYLQAWYQKNFGRFRTYDDMEDCVPDVYEAFLDAPAKFLNGQKPGAYFAQYDDPTYLVRWLAAYIQEEVCVPDMLLNRIAELGGAAAPALYEALMDETAPAELRMHLVSLLREIESTLPFPDYVQWTARWDGHDELTENAIEALESDGDSDPRLPDLIRAAYGSATPAGQAALLSVFSRLSADHDMLENALSLFRREPSLRMELAAILARFGSEEALPVLKKAAQSHETGYLLYIELRSAIEALGGTAPRRTFADSDPEYESMRHLEDRLTSQQDS